MTNFEYYKDEILKRYDQGLEDLAMKNGKFDDCSNVLCKLCNFSSDNYNSDHCCTFNMLHWLYQEHRVKPKLTQREFLLCKLIEKGWVARDKSGFLYIYENKPQKVVSDWHDTGAIQVIREEFYRVSFNFIKWEDTEPWSIKELLKLEVEETCVEKN